ncbi:hypothetical protein N7457_001968 [Penicillium paradoxum]|uniref:uncharacterized protein n=1 Tax=Penicillium paradoxum TaxID=176176 RepID=UPI00254973F5|nr:uncharacterized protein N7457_001968 [Penicillium paradoxum]KAJ5786978.1 hypothetical protein N7457_001968 [Penicillium paradoxum]
MIIYTLVLEYHPYSKSMSPTTSTETDSESVPSVGPASVPTTPEQSLNGGAHQLNTESSSISTTVEEDIDPKSRAAAGPIRSICCVGAGYVGGPTAAVIALKNPHIQVNVVDKDERRIRKWNSRHLPIYEPGLAEIVRIARDGFLMATSDEPPSLTFEAQAHKEPAEKSIYRRPNLFFSTNVSRFIRESDIVIIAVNTPTKIRGSGAGSATDMTAYQAVAADVVQHARSGSIIVEKSTVPCRTAQMVQEMACYIPPFDYEATLTLCVQIAVRRPGAQFEILSNPEFLAAGTAIQDLLNPDRVIIGSATTTDGQNAAEILASMYAGWVDRARIITTNIWSSELAKLVANSMLAQRLSSINSISAICEATGAQINEVSTSIGMDHRIGEKFLRAGIGFGGSCFKKDVLSLVYLAESLGLKEVGKYWRQVVIMNEYQRNRFTSRVIRSLDNTLVCKKITLLGYAFKKNTSDTRETPALEIIKTLLDENPGEIAIFDPCCNPYIIESEIRQLSGYGSPTLGDDGGAVKCYSDVYEACASSNAILIVTEFDEFQNTDPVCFPCPSDLNADSIPLSAVPNSHARQETLSGAGTMREPASDGSIEERFRIEPSCAADCIDCQRENNRDTSLSTLTDNFPKKRINWERIVKNMEPPKWLFDGRCIIDTKKMTKLGIRVESIGSAENNG